ncbi:MAG: AraC family transcriptional regulator [Saprospiraceae bacterium]|nr:AraC family transcriptional regulator [Saprospiraceae bacterium]
METPKQIAFQNRQNPGASFDVVNLHELYQRKDLDHSPFSLHRVEFYILFFIREGTGKHTVDFTTHSFRKGSILTVRKDQIHRFHRNEKARGTMLLFTDEFLVSYLEKLEALKSLQLFNEVLSDPHLKLSPGQQEATIAQIARISKEYFSINDDYSLGIIRSELHILLTRLYRIKYQRKPIFRHKKYLSEFIALQDLVENHAHQTLRVGAYAKMLGISTKTLNTITRSIVQKTAKAFIDDVSIKQIKRLLINTDLQVSEIAYASGFPETTNFYKYFKRHTHSTPEQFRIGQGERRNDS